ncbi:transcriptional regulator, TetR family [Caminicella sporogenes DSM 14501]|uniref:Transcriptional regulator, TetR family n=1 Tax=Caminicella sporogenes DSM 14501 TaxID=1121266 RepID=A0A1M6RMT2_9FIRM|nr:TetR/AcrR family transcriptional regulator [Caminicella sporogenes]RKD23699.1 TetR family transcriptional regulator [Caminicella sporogenes]SHK33749.1 transcriptional regulator, TetR family [Caminicella sporogenes DSM 14501]
MDKKQIQKKRMMAYFIQAANKIIEEEGIEAVTIRKVADLAGYNSATIYNYFENLDHLIFFTCMKYLREYVLSLPQNFNKMKNSIDKYLAIWKAFCYHSFKNPKIYYRIFFNKYSNSLDDTIKLYYEIFPEELGKQSYDLLPMLLGQNIYDRNMYILESCFLDENLTKKDIEEINEIHILLYQAMLLRIINEQIDFTIEEAINRILLYMKRIMLSYTK